MYRELTIGLLDMTMLHACRCCMHLAEGMTVHGPALWLVMHQPNRTLLSQPRHEQWSKLVHRLYTCRAPEHTSIRLGKSVAKMSMPEHSVHLDACVTIDSSHTLRDAKGYREKVIQTPANKPAQPMHPC